MKIDILQLLDGARSARGLLADGAARRAINHSNYPAFKAKKD